VCRRCVREARTSRTSPRKKELHFWFKKDTVTEDINKWGWGGGAVGYGGGTQRLGGRALDGQRKEGWLCGLEEATIGGCWAHVWSHMRKSVQQRGVGSRMAGCRGWSGLVIPCRELGNTTHPRWGRGGFDLSLYRP
jgi:hypothetical protein